MGLFTGKKVVLCGPAPHITETKQDFSGYDYVCRLNAMIPLSDELIEATGNRIDVWYPANLLLTMKPELSQYPKIIRTTGNGEKLVPPKYRNKISYMNSHFQKLKSKVDCTPNRALRAMVDILKDKPKLLYVTGITFYKTGGYYKSYTFYESSNAVTVEKKGDIGGHKQEPQFNYFLKYIAPKIKMDSVLKEICNNHGKQTS
jgi:hypothetical protein